MSHSNPHVIMFSLMVLESCVKNCGSLVHDEIGTKAYMEQLREAIKTTQHENVKNKLLELIQAWAYAFRNIPKYRAVQDTVNIMKAEGYKFPALKESDAMFSADTAPQWADGERCHRCRVQFGIMQRKHHCRACGQVFCSQCTTKSCTLPKFGIEKEVRVCEACYEKVSKPATSSKSEDLPVEYLKSSLAQQSQAPPPRKSEAELKEEEDLQLALALSQSEAEVKINTRTNPISTATPKSYSPPPKAASSPESDPELARYLNRSYWQQQSAEFNSPSAPAQPQKQTNNVVNQLPTQNGLEETEMEEFVSALRSQVEIFVNRMKSNSSRGRSIANDSSVQTLFLNITAMHSKLLKYIQQQDDSRVYFEGLQDKLSQVKDARAALDALRDEHREKLRRQAEMAERQRQIQMAQKLDIMRKKKQEYLQYQRQLALQRIQEQEREMQLRQEQQKQQYMMGTYSSLPYMPTGYDGQGSIMPGRFPPPGPGGPPPVQHAGAPGYATFSPQGTQLPVDPMLAQHMASHMPMPAAHMIVGSDQGSMMSSGMVTGPPSMQRPPMMGAPTGGLPHAPPPATPPPHRFQGPPTTGHMIGPGGMPMVPPLGPSQSQAPQMGLPLHLMQSGGPPSSLPPQLGSPTMAQPNQIITQPPYPQQPPQQPQQQQHADPLPQPPPTQPPSAKEEDKTAELISFD
ncbi:hepatocyte growth factor regulated tyrosine kinase substrate isoform X2 [Rhodnius prolixus]